VAPRETTDKCEINALGPHGLRHRLKHSAKVHAVRLTLEAARWEALPGNGSVCSEWMKDWAEEMMTSLRIPVNPAFTLLSHVQD
jgi:hypothetical protein